MEDSPEIRAASWLALAVPAALLGGALIAQYGFGLPPCEMCWWQRYAHIAALVLAVASLALGKIGLVRLAAAAIAVGGLLGAYHAGVEYGWWTGITSCSGGSLGNDPLASIMNAPVIRCDVSPWDLFGISLAGWNFLISMASAAAILVLLSRGRARI